MLWLFWTSQGNYIIILCHLIYIIVLTQISINNYIISY